MKALTIRGVDSEVAEKLKSTAAKQGKSVNQLALDLLKESLDLRKKKLYSRRYDDLDDLFGRWSEAEFNEIQSAISQERKVDPELWK